MILIVLAALLLTAEGLSAQTANKRLLEVNRSLLKALKTLNQRETKVGSANCEECIRDFGRDHFTCSMCTSTETKVGSANCEECIRDFGRDHFTCSMCTATETKLGSASVMCCDDMETCSCYDGYRGRTSTCTCAGGINPCKLGTQTCSYHGECDPNCEKVQITAADHKCGPHSSAGGSSGCCTKDNPCPLHAGDCNSDDQCEGSLRCNIHNQGDKYGYSNPKVDVCGTGHACAELGRGGWYTDPEECKARYDCELAAGYDRDGYCDPKYKPSIPTLRNVVGAEESVGETQVSSANCEECIRDFGRDHFTCSMCTSAETKVGSANCEECIRDFGRDHFTCSMCTSTETKVGSANCEECIRDFGRDHFTCSMCTSTETKVGSANCEECIRDFGRDHFTCSMCTSTALTRERAVGGCEDDATWTDGRYSSGSYSCRDIKEKFGTSICTQSGCVEVLRRETGKDASDPWLKEFCTPYVPEYRRGCPASCGAC